MFGMSGQSMMAMRNAMLKARNQKAMAQGMPMRRGEAPTIPGTGMGTFPPVKYPAGTGSSLVPPVGSSTAQNQAASAAQSRPKVVPSSTPIRKSPSATGGYGGQNQVQGQNQQALANPPPGMPANPYKPGTPNYQMFIDKWTKSHGR